MFTYLLRALLLFCSVNAQLLAMDFSYVPESNTVIIPATHATLRVRTQPQQATSTQQAPVSINPATIYSNPILNPTMPYHLLQLAQMASVHNGQQAQSSSSNATLGDQLSVQLFRMQQQGDRGALRGLLKSRSLSLSTTFAPVNVQKIKAEIKLILSILQNPITDIFAQIKEEPLSIACECVQKLKDDAPRGAFNHVYMFANQILYARIDYQEQRAQDARKTRIGIHSRGDIKALNSDRESLEAEIKRCTDEKIRKILTFQLQDVQERFEDPMLAMLHAITVATDVAMVQTAYQQVIDTNATRPTTYIHGGPIKQGSPLHPDYFGFNVVAAANRLHKERMSQLNAMSLSVEKTTASSSSPITTAATGPGTTTSTYAQSPIVPHQNADIVFDTQALPTSSRMSDSMTLDSVLFDLVTTTRSQNPEYAALHALTCEFFTKIMSQESLFFDVLSTEILADRAAQYEHQYTQQFAASQQEVKEAKIQEEQRITAELKEYIQAHIPKDCTGLSDLAHGFVTRIKTIGMAKDLTHCVVEVTDLCVDTLMHLVLLSKQRADNPLAHATVHQSAKIFKLLDTLSIKNMEQICQKIDALTDKQKAELCGMITADTITIIGISRIPGTISTYLNNTSTINTEGLIGRSLQQATQSVSQKADRLRILVEDLGLTHKPETIATTVEGISVQTGAMTAVEETMSFHDTTQKVGSVVENAKRVAQISADIENILTKNKNILESFDGNISELAKTVKPGKVGKVLEKAHVNKLSDLELETRVFYEKMRESALDIEKICQNTGFDRNIITRIKNHLFNEEHLLRNGIGKFHPDEDIAAAWQRLIDNNYVYSDLKLLQHEYAESLVMNGLEMAYDEVHPIVNAIYNWEKSL